MSTKNLGASGMLLAASIVLITSACASHSARNARLEPDFDEDYTTCLKRGLAADTQEHTDCVIALHESRENQLSRLREIAPGDAKDKAATESVVGDPTSRTY